MVFIFSVKVNLEDVKNEWLRTSGPYQIRRIAEHYGIYQHLFGDAYFTPRTVLNVQYPLPDDEYAVPVYYGNIIKPIDVKTKPDIFFESDPGTLWTLALTNPDGHLTKQDSEYVHWLV